MKCVKCNAEVLDNKNELGICVECCAKGQADNPWCEIPSEEERKKMGTEWGEWEISADHWIPIELYCPSLIPACPGEIIVTATQFYNQRPCHDKNHADATHWRFHYEPESISYPHSEIVL